MRLLSSPASPFVRKVQVLLLETDQSDVEIADVTAHPLGGDASLNATAPLGKIPALERDGGPTIFDSRVICRFLDNRAQAGLYPEARLWETLTLEALADGIMDAAVIMVYEKRARPEEMWHQPWLDAQWSKVERGLDALERQWMSHLHGPLDMAQLAVGCALGYLDFRHDDKGWRDGRDSLAAWYKTFSTRPSMVETAPA
ncbi:MAG: glutathione S-transferase family protein [Pseudomonadota bacterium]